MWHNGEYWLRRIRRLWIIKQYEEICGAMEKWVIEPWRHRRDDVEFLETLTRKSGPPKEREPKYMGELDGNTSGGSEHKAQVG